MDHLALVTYEHDRWQRYFPDLKVRATGKDEQVCLDQLEVAVAERLTQVLAEGSGKPSPSTFTREELSKDEFPLHGKWSFQQITPRMPNPVSLTIRQAVTH